MKMRFLFRALRVRYRDQRQEIATVLSALRPGDAAADIGSHKGAYVYWLRHAVGSGGKVFAFEPQASLAAYLESACAAMCWSNVWVNGCALSDHEGTATLHVPGTGTSPGASLRKPGPESTVAGRSQLCRVDTLDHVLSGETGLKFMKIDVEGHELQVLRGAQETIARNAPVILFECEARHLTNTLMAQVFAFLQERERNVPGNVRALRQKQVG